MIEFFYSLQLEHQVLLVLFLMSYIAAMLIQIKDPNTDVHFLDWILAFLASGIGGTLTWFGVMSWANLGVRMTATILVSLMSYRTLKFLVSDEAQDEFAKGFWEAVSGIASRIFSNHPKDKTEDEEDE